MQLSQCTEDLGGSNPETVMFMVNLPDDPDCY